jgi:hypothetical protein
MPTGVHRNRVTNSVQRRRNREAEEQRAWEYERYCQERALRQVHFHLRTLSHQIMTEDEKDEQYRQEHPWWSLFVSRR